MSKFTRHIIALLIIIIPFYFVAFLQKTLLNMDDIFAEQFLGVYMLLGLIGISTVLLVNKYLLKNKLNVFVNPDCKPIVDISIGLLMLAILYFVQSLERITYGIWLHQEIDRTAILALLEEIFSNTLYSIIIVGPFNWINEGFAILSIAFILNNLWELNQKRSWIWISIGITAIIFSALQINMGFSGMISSFLVTSLTSYIYLKNRSVFPLLMAGITYQTIDLLNFWIFH